MITITYADIPVESQRNIAVGFIKRENRDWIAAQRDRSVTAEFVEVHKLFNSLTRMRPDMAFATWLWDSPEQVLSDKDATPRARTAAEFALKTWR